MCPRPTTAYRTGPLLRATVYFFLPELVERFLARFRGGTFAPLSLASLSAMAIACFRLVTFLPEPLFSDPFFRRRMADSTFFKSVTRLLRQR